VFLFSVNHLFHFATFFLKQNKLFMLQFHSFFIFTLFLLESAEGFFGHSQFIIEFLNFTFVFSLLIQLLKRPFLFFLDLEKWVGLVLKLFENSFFVFLFVFKRNNFLNVVAPFELSAHLLDLFFIKLNFGLRRFKLILFGLNRGVFLNQRRGGFGVPWLFNEGLELAG
jgi:hypothetical protein